MGKAQYARTHGQWRQRDRNSNTEQREREREIEGGRGREEGRERGKKLQCKRKGKWRMPLTGLLVDWIQLRKEPLSLKVILVEIIETEEQWEKGLKKIKQTKYPKMWDN